MKSGECRSRRSRSCAPLGLDRPEALGDPVPVGLLVLDRAEELVAHVVQRRDLLVVAEDLYRQGAVVLVLTQVVVVELGAD